MMPTDSASPTHPARRAVRLGSVLLLGGCLAATTAAPAFAQVTPPQEGVRVGITYQPGVRPGLLVLEGPGDAWLDSIRTILRRDLEFSDEFEVITLPPDDSTELGIGSGPSGEFVNYRLYSALGSDVAVRVRPGEPLTLFVYDVGAETVRRELAVTVPPLEDAGFRMAVHRISDEVVRSVTGQAGIAATRFLFLQRGRIYRVDSDGADVQPVTPAGAQTFSPAWSPGGRQVAYTEFHDQGGRLYVQAVDGGARRLVGTTDRALNYTPAFSPDGRTLVFSRSDDGGTDVFAYDVERDCCIQRLTSGRFADNLSPTFSPDGRRIAFVSTRAGAPQIYAMSSDGTGQELFAPFDYGVTGSSNAPEWSPDGRNVAFHRDVGGSPQIFLMDVQSRTVRQLTSAGRNEDPTWAPDGRHLAFVSSRTGNRQIWVIDLETGRVRQVTRGGEARLPAWSGRLY
jgi:TolB protein